MNLPNRILQAVNGVGVLLLVGLCALQWQDNRRLAADNNRLTQTTRDQAAKMADQDKTLAADAIDLADLRQQLGDSELKQKQAESARARVTAQRDQLSAQVAADQSALNSWKGAVAQRDQVIAQAAQQQQTLAHQRDDVIGRFNDLANRYNSLVKSQSAR
jgi:septal ring factor EnvC (AmiA/AmiB activator)